jgi:hypothetical protein
MQNKEGDVSSMQLELIEYRNLFYRSCLFVIKSLFNVSHLAYVWNPE